MKIGMPDVIEKLPFNKKQIEGAYLSTCMVLEGITTTDHFSF